MSALQNSYHTFVDVMEFKDVTVEVITAMASNGLLLDIVSFNEECIFSTYVVMETL